MDDKRFNELCEIKQRIRELTFFIERCHELKEDNRNNVPDDRRMINTDSRIGLLLKDLKMDANQEYELLETFSIMFENERDILADEFNKA